MVMLLSSWQYHLILECNPQKLGEISIIHGQPNFERTESKMLMIMHIALDQNRPQILSGEVNTCKHND